eukprot:14874330-Alexandrium_andersonii.AAC.1
MAWAVLPMAETYNGRGGSTQRRLLRALPHLPLNWAPYSGPRPSGRVTWQAASRRPRSRCAR